ncbi:MAG: hypothetical protein LBD03_01060 [Methanobrevibacter sp.]|jgi:hypothetical protein|nr:hypothetical protein [Candidatus Methanovirga procula]
MFKKYGLVIIFLIAISSVSANNLYLNVHSINDDNTGLGVIRLYNTTDDNYASVDIKPGETLTFNLALSDHNNIEEMVFHTYDKVNRCNANMKHFHDWKNHNRKGGSPDENITLDVWFYTTPGYYDNIMVHGGAWFCNDQTDHEFPSHLTFAQYKSSILKFECHTGYLGDAYTFEKVSIWGWYHHFKTWE